jgi:nephrocystin-3
MSFWKRWFGKKGAASDAPISGEAGGQVKKAKAKTPAAEINEVRSRALEQNELIPDNHPTHRTGTNTWEIRVFVSSTFRDMIQERDLLVKHVFPQLRRECAKRQVTFTEVDLRWGITDAESSEGKVLPLCLAEIERCRPYFIGLLGERYGWVPEALAEELMQEQAWLKNHLDHSVTELEILHGVLKSPLMRDRSLFYFRSPGYIDQVPVENRADFLEDNQERAVRLSGLKQRLREEHARGHLRFAPREDYPDPESLGQMILADFTQLIDALYPLDQVPDPLDQEAMRHSLALTTDPVKKMWPTMCSFGAFTNLQN